MSSPVNRHAVVLALAERGVVILGPSGAGKTTLALSLIDRMNSRLGFARLVADDQVFLEARAGRIVASVPPAIAGLAEAYGAGPAPLPHLAATVLDLALELVEAEDTQRLADDEVELLPGHTLPLLRLTRRSAAGNALAVLARLRLPPFC